MPWFGTVECLVRPTSYIVSQRMGTVYAYHLECIHIHIDIAITTFRTWEGIGRIGKDRLKLSSETLLLRDT